MEQTPQRPERRNRRRPSRLQQFIYRYFPSICLVGLSIVCVSMVILTVQTISNTVRGSMEDSSQLATTPSDSIGTTDSVDQQQINELLDKADFIAGGYDYQSAIALLQTHPGYENIADITARIETYTQLDEKLVTYTDLDNVTHIFFHSLIVDPERAFDGDRDEKGYNLYMVTVREFKAMLQQMYDRGFVLVSPYDIAYEKTDAAGNTVTSVRDENGNIILSKDALGNETKYEYDENQNPVKIIAPDGTTTTMTYDEYGQLLSITTLGLDIL